MIDNQSPSPSLTVPQTLVLELTESQRTTLVNELVQLASPSRPDLQQLLGAVVAAKPNVLQVEAPVKTKARAAVKRAPKTPASPKATPAARKSAAVQDALG